jgi:hypothetical protein
MEYDNQIFKFKERVNIFNKLLKSMEIKPNSKKALEPIEIFVKEDNKKNYIQINPKVIMSLQNQKKMKIQKKNLKKLTVSQI